MASIWVESLGRSFDQALDLLAGAVGECTEEMWETPMWQVPAPGPDRPFLGSDWKPITDPAQRDELVQGWVERWSTPWSVAWHALETFDYDLTGELARGPLRLRLMGTPTGAIYRACRRPGHNPRSSVTSTTAASGYTTRWQG